MAHISIIGTGKMGQAIAAAAARGGNTVQMLGAGDGATAVAGGIVVLAVPYSAISAVITERGASLAGKIVVDITNLPNSETVAADSSATAEIAAALPGSRVLKAFNTTFADTLSTGKIGDLTTTVLIAGDDADAKAELAGAFTSGGLKAIDAGSLKRARELEAFGFLQIALATAEKISLTGGFAVIA
jgi:predicted dinucleotide-binding enzyme